MPWLRFILGPDFPADRIGAGPARLVVKNPHAIGWVILFAIVLAGVALLMYRADSAAHPKPVRRYVAAGLRIAFFAFLLTMILRPAVRFDLEGSVRRGLILLFDDSASMKIADPRPADADRRRAAIAAGAVEPTLGLDAPAPPTSQPSIESIARLDLVKAGFRNEKLSLIKKLATEYDLRSASFAQSLGELPPVASHDALTGGGRATALGDALRDVLARTRGQPLAGVVLVTDGASNTGSDPLAVAANVAREHSIPLYVWGVGTTAPKDVIVTSVFAQDVAFLDDTVNVVARVRATGMAGRTARLAVQLDQQTVAFKDVSFAANADGVEQVVELTFTPKKAGEFKLTASIVPGADEVVKDNNAQSQPIRVIDAKIKVLLVERSPRWEFKYLQALLLRDRRVQVKCVLTEADPAIAAAPGSPYLARFPSSREELFAYDLIVLGDVDPRSFAAGQLDAINEFVARLGGGFLMIAGKSYAPAAYRGTAIEKLLPVELESSGFRVQGSGADENGNDDRPIRVELSPAGKREQAMRLADTEVESELVWAKLPQLFWVAPGVTRGKPAAEVLLTRADAPRSSGSSSPRDTKPPVIAIQQYGLGQACYVGTDNTWRWRRNAGDRYHTMLWGQLVQRLSLSHLLGESKRTQLRTEQRTYTPGQRTTVFGRLFNERYEPVADAVVSGAYWPRDNATARQPITLRAVPDQPGMYRGEFPSPAAPGDYVLALDRDPRSTHEFAVSDPKIELAETAMNEPMLKQLATTTGGAFFREEDLYKLPDAIRLKAERIRSTLDVEIWSSPIWFALMIGLLGAEWVLRKMMQMK